MTLSTASIEWLSTYGPSKEVSDTGTPLHPALLISSPPPQSLAGFWSLTGVNESDQLLALTVPIGAIVDVWVEQIVNDGQTPVTQSISNTATAGQVYALAFDGVSSNKLVPVSYTTIN